MKKHIKKLVRV